MKKQFCMAMMVVTVVLLTAAMTTAASHKNLMGTWDAMVNFVGWDSSNPDPDKFYFSPNFFSYEIQDEDLATGNFYGLRNGFYPFTGNVSINKKVTIIEYGADAEYRILTGTVSGKKMTGTMQHFKSGHIDTGTFTFYKE